MLIGQYASKLTDKDRISVPKKFRDELGDDLVIARWYENCLVLVSKAKWEELITRVVGKTGLIVTAVRDIDRFILASAFEIKLDYQGRFIIPDILQRFAAIVTDVVFIGLGDRVEIWSQEQWQKLEDLAETKATLAIEKIAKNMK